MGLCIFLTKSYQLAISRYEEVIKIKEKVEKDPLALTKTYNNLGQTFCALQMWPQAQKLYLLL